MLILESNMVNYMIKLLFLPTCYGFLAFDCSNPNINYTLVNTREVEECIISTPEIVEEKVSIQLLQLNSIAYAKYVSCKVSMNRIISYCGMNSHVSMVHNGYASFIVPITNTECWNIHRDRRYILPNLSVVSNLKPNSTIEVSSVLSGKLFSDGKCEGGSYNDKYGSWESVIVQAIYKIQLTEGYTQYDRDTNYIHLPYGINCIYDRIDCVHPDIGMTTWDVFPTHECDDNRHLVLFDGFASKTTTQSLTGENMKVVTYMVTSSTRAFALSVTTRYDKCSMEVWRTEHPRLLILVVNQQWDKIKSNSIDISSLDLMAYVNAKLIMIQASVASNVESLYQTLDYRRCMAERKSLRNQLALASLSPQEFAYLYMGKPGYTSLPMGEVSYIIQCNPVEVKLRKTDKCYHELPISLNNQSFYMSPKTRLIQSQGTEVECNHLMLPKFLLGKNWYEIYNGARLSEVPTTLSANYEHGWKYTSIKDLASSGIYSQDDIDKLRRYIMAPNERTAITNTLSDVINGNIELSPDLKVTNLIGPQTLESLASKLSSKIWSMFTLFGHVSSGVIGIYMLARLIKLIVDTAVHGTILYNLYGWSICLIGGIWDSITHYLIYRKRHETKKGDTTMETESLEVSAKDYISEAPLKNIHINQQRVTYPNLERFMP
ncbi:glycoprotein [Lishi spider virus 1]|uniref:Glycoprotein n=1 Tax=Lishi spider virus 1 TaxID=1608057 RepID=A0A0B5KEN2_9VIRU|nr:glycoprotein [Lishi spider virus 1]AJG39049.1 glycoprotein [Lishi spider virus 1]